MSGADASGRRLDPSGKRALFEAPVDVADDVLHGRERSGKDALFSVGPRSGTARVTCSRCQERTRVSLTDLGLRVVRLSAWNPLRRHSHWITCPACEHRAWCHVSVTR